MDQGEAFLEAIREAPEDDAVRLVYADWLEDEGQVDRAEFIRLQCELARLGPGDPKGVKLRKRERALLKQHETDWGELVGFPSSVRGEMRRGFLEHIALPAGE